MTTKRKSGTPDQQRSCEAVDWLIQRLLDSGSATRVDWERTSNRIRVTVSYSPTRTVSAEFERSDTGLYTRVG